MTTRKHSRPAWRQTRTTDPPYYAWWRHVADGEGVTVFPSDDGWKWVYDGEFSEPFDDEVAAMNAAEDELEL